MENGDDSSVENVEPEPEDDLNVASLLDGNSFSSNDDTAEDESPTKSQCSDANDKRSFTPASDHLSLSSDEETRASALDDSLVEGAAALKYALESMGSNQATQDLQLSSDSSLSDLNSSNTTNNDDPGNGEINRFKLSEQLDNFSTSESREAPSAKSVECPDSQTINSASVDDSFSQDSCHSDVDTGGPSVDFGTLKDSNAATLPDPVALAAPDQILHEDSTSSEKKDEKISNHLGQPEEENEATKEEVQATSEVFQESDQPSSPQPNSVPSQSPQPPPPSPPHSTPSSPVPEADQGDVTSSNLTPQHVLEEGSLQTCDSDMIRNDNDAIQTNDSYESDFRAVECSDSISRCVDNSEVSRDNVDTEFRLFENEEDTCDKSERVSNFESQVMNESASLDSLAEDELLAEPKSDPITRGEVPVCDRGEDGVPMDLGDTSLGDTSAVADHDDLGGDIMSFDHSNDEKEERREDGPADDEEDIGDVEADGCEDGVSDEGDGDNESSEAFTRVNGTLSESMDCDDADEFKQDPQESHPATPPKSEKPIIMSKNLNLAWKKAFANTARRYQEGIGITSASSPAEEPTQSDSSCILSQSENSSSAPSVELVDDSTHEESRVSSPTEDPYYNATSEMEPSTVSHEPEFSPQPTNSRSKFKPSGVRRKKKIRRERKSPSSVLEETTPVSSIVHQQPFYMHHNLQDETERWGTQPHVMYKCMRCGLRGFTSMHDLRNHQLLCLRNPAIPLPREQQASTSPDDGKVRITRKVLLCSACGTFYENWNLFLHMREVHKRHICLYCLGMFSEAEKLSLHLVSKHKVSGGHYASPDDFKQSFKGLFYLMCCTCERMFTDENFTNHTCRRDMVVCNSCQGHGFHLPSCQLLNSPLHSVDGSDAAVSWSTHKTSETSQINESEKSGDHSHVSFKYNRLGNKSKPVLKVKIPTVPPKRLGERRVPEKNCMSVPALPAFSHLQSSLPQDVLTPPLSICDPGSSFMSNLDRTIDAVALGLTEEARAWEEHMESERRRIEEARNIYTDTEDENESEAGEANGSIEDVDHSSSSSGSDGDDDDKDEELEEEEGDEEEEEAEEEDVPVMVTEETGREEESQDEELQTLEQQPEWPYSKEQEPVRADDQGDGVGDEQGQDACDEQEDDAGNEQGHDAGDVDFEAEQAQEELNLDNNQVQGCSDTNNLSLDENFIGTENAEGNAEENKVADESSSVTLPANLSHSPEPMDVEPNLAEGACTQNKSCSPVATPVMEEESLNVEAEPETKENDLGQGESLPEPPPCEATEPVNDSISEEPEVSMSLEEPPEVPPEELQEEPKKEPIEEKPSDGIPLAGEDVPEIELSLDKPLHVMKIQEVLKECVRYLSWSCVYCGHAKKIAVNGKQLALHMLSEHRIVPVDGIQHDTPASELLISKVKDSLDFLQSTFFNTDSYDSTDKANSLPYDRSYECFHCHFYTRLHKELYVHNRKMHQKTILLCIMCKSNFYSYSELLSHLCPGIYIPQINITFRCCMCDVDELPSAFRLMVHLRKKHNACDVCLEVTDDQQKLSNHVWKHKLHHLCYRCGIAYRNKPDITKHLFWKHGTESVLCKKCLQKKWPHMYHFCVPPAAFTCEECSAMFTRAVALRVHKRFHSEDFRYPCTECEDKFVSKKLLSKHLDKHRNPVPEPPAIAPEVATEPTLKELRGNDPPPSDGKVSPVPEAKEPVKNISMNDEAKDETVNTTSKSPPTSPQSSKHVKKKKQKREDPEEESRQKKAVDVFDLPPLNLSSDSDSSDEEPAKKSADPVTNGPPPQTSPLPSPPTVEERPEPDEPAPIVDGIWDKFQNFQASLEKRDVVEDARSFLCKTIEMEHDYCLPAGKPKPDNPDSSEGTDKSEKAAVEPKVDSKDDPSPSADANGTPKSSPKKKKTTKKRKRANSGRASSSSSSDSSSDSDSDSSSSSCGSNCSCSSHSSSSSSSSSSSDSDDSSSSEGRRKAAARREKRKEKAKDKTAKNEEELSTEKLPSQEDTNQPATTQLPVEEPHIDVMEGELTIRESDLDTTETETDEDFYDDNPQKLANELLQEKRNLMLLAAVAPTNNGGLSPTQSHSSQPPSAAPSEATPSKRKSKKRRKKGSSCRAVEEQVVTQDCSGVQEQITEWSHHPDQSYHPYGSQSNSMNAIENIQPYSSASVPVASSPGFPPTPSPAQQYGVKQTMSKFSALSTRSTGSGSETEGRIKRKRMRNKFYGYSSGEDDGSGRHKIPKQRKSNANSNYQSSVSYQTNTSYHASASYHSSQYETPPQPVMPPLTIKRSQIKASRAPPPASETVYESTLVPTTWSSSIVNQQKSDSDSDSEAKPQANSSSDTDSDDDAMHIAESPPPPPQYEASRTGEPQANLYCYCQCPYDEVSEMIACDGENCKIEWFHFECVGIMVPPKGQWYCPDCRRRMGLPEQDYTLNN